MASTGALNHPLIIIIASSNSINFLTPQNDTQHYFNTQDSVFPLSLRFIDTNLYGYPSPSFLCFLFLFHVCFVLSFHRILLSRWSWIEIAPFQNTGIVAIGCNATGQLLSDRCNIFFIRCFDLLSSTFTIPLFYNLSASFFGYLYSV